MTEPRLAAEEDLVDLATGSPVRSYRHHLNGVALIAIGSFFGYVTTVMPIQEAQQGARRLEISTTGTTLSVLAIIVGLAYLFVGRRAGNLVGSADNDARSVNWPFITIVLLITLAIYFSLKGYLESLGYIFQ